ncbi:MAG TPA: HemK2/MTQ2 family protein methyltransferase [Thermoplasmata archaeon]|nr:HemK2/MTQ2 family protein methyltransferase [Thermoplasmata archaeon]
MAAVPVGVYPPREDTELLARAAQGTRGLRVLEIGTGSGEVGLTAARVGACVVVTDLNPVALRWANGRARAEGLRLDAVRTDLAVGLGRFDVVLANPPYLPTPARARDPDRWVNLALDGGRDGLTVTRRIVASLPGWLRPGGAAYLVISSRQDRTGRRRLAANWKRSGGTRTVVARRRLGNETLELWRFTPPAA